MIADLSDAKSVLQELQAIVPTSPMLAVQPLIASAQEDPGMFDFLRKFHWFLETHRYDSPSQLIADLYERVIRPAEAKVVELRGPQPTQMAGVQPSLRARKGHANSDSFQAGQQCTALRSIGTAI